MRHQAGPSRLYCFTPRSGALPFPVPRYSWASVSDVNVRDRGTPDVDEPPACRCSGAPDVGENPHPDPGLTDSVEGCAVEEIAGRMRGLLLIEPCCPACATPRRLAHGCGAHYQSSASFSGDDAPNRGNSWLAAHRGRTALAGADILLTRGISTRAGGSSGKDVQRKRPGWAAEWPRGPMRGPLAPPQ